MIQDVMLAIGLHLTRTQAAVHLALIEAVGEIIEITFDIQPYRCSMTNKILAIKVGKCRQTVCRAIDRLSEMRALTVKRGGRCKPNVYTLNVNPDDLNVPTTIRGHNITPRMIYHPKSPSYTQFRHGMATGMYLREFDPPSGYQKMIGVPGMMGGIEKIPPAS